MPIFRYAHRRKSCRPEAPDVTVHGVKVPRAGTRDVQTRIQSAISANE